MQVIQRSEAKSLGLKFYFTGKACKRGHVAQRQVSDHACTQCRSEYREQHKEAHAQYFREYEAANREKVNARHRAWRARNKDRSDEIKKRWADSNPEKCEAAKSRWKSNNRDKVRKASSDWRKKNPELYANYYRARRAAEKSAEGSHTAEDIKRLEALQRMKCATCRTDLRKSGYHIDHIVALVNGGSNYPENIQLLCPPCNLRKSRKDPIQWANENGLLC